MIVLEEFKLKCDGLKSKLNQDWNEFYSLFNKINNSALIFEILPDGSRGPILYANEAATKKLEYEHNELIGMTIDIIDSPKTMSSRPSIAERFKDTSIAVFDVEHFSKSGNIIPVFVYAYKFKHDGKNMILSVSQEKNSTVESNSTFKDDSSCNFESIFENLKNIIINIPSSILIYELKTEKRINLKFENDLATSEKIRFAQLTENNFDEELKNILNKFIKTNKKNDSYYDQTKNFKFNISFIYDQILCVNIEIIKDNKNIVKAINEKEELYRTFFKKNSSVMYLLAPETGAFIDANKAAQSFYGYSRNELLNLTIFDINHLPVKDTKDLIKKVTANKLNRIITKHRLANGDLKDVEIFTSPCIFENQKIIISITHDITDRLKYKAELEKSRIEAEKANKAKNEFLANMSHELRTPLNGVIGMLQLLNLNTKLDPTQKQYTSYALESCMRITNLVGDILDLSRLETGSMSLNNVPFEIDTMISSLETIFKPAAYNANIDLITSVSEKVPNKVIGDKNKLQQILTNLLSNAVKFTQDGEVKLMVENLRNKDSDKTNLLFTISDTGIGMDELEIEKMFDTFTQGDIGNTKRYQGAGLGLSIVKSMVHILEGKIETHSKKNIGTTVCISIPVYHADQQKLAPETPEQNVKGKKELKILVVEDDKINQLAITRNLARYGYKIDSAEDGSKALNKLSTGHFDLVLMDIQMPVMNGTEATQKIRSGEVGNQYINIPIIAITAYAMPGDRQKFLESGMNEYIAKPIEINELINIIEAFFNNKAESDNKIMQ